MAEDLSNFKTSDDIQDFLLSEEDSVGGTSINRILEHLLANDLQIAGNFKEVPGVWFCKWYNSTKGRGAGRGYDRGKFFWVNTENVENFIRDNNEKIRSLANVNPCIVEKLPKWKNNDSEIYEKYYNVLTGYITAGMSKKLDPLYDIGDLSNSFQIVVSQKNNNTDLIEQLSSWKHFAVNTDEDYENIMFTIDKLTLSAMQFHIEEYHIGNLKYTQEDIDNLSNYADEDFSNVTYMYPKNFLDNDFYSAGLDCVDVYVRKPYPGSQQSHPEETWFRKWKSGFLEHGGIIDVRRYLNDRKDLVTVPFSWKFLDDGSKLYQLDYLGTRDNSVIELDESYQSPPGDNMISVLYELDNLIVDKSEYSPSYASNDYVVSLTPIQQQFDGTVGVESVESYEGIGSRSVEENVLNIVVDPSRCTKDHFVFKYNKNTTPNYYSYYVRGFCR